MYNLSGYSYEEWEFDWFKPAWGHKAPMELN